MESLLSIVVGFVLTGLIGNRLLQSWQARNWFLQQRFLGQEKEYLALKELADEIASLLGVRIFHMHRLNRALARGADEKINSRVQEYDDAVKRWNERLTSFYVRLPMLARYDLAIRLERSIQAELVKTGATIENLVVNRRPGASIPQKEAIRVENELNAIQGKAIAFNKQLLDVVHSRRTDIYFGKPLTFSPQTLKYFSTWQLFKALFIRDVNSLSIVRAPMDS
jgi:hypothetical protein